MDFYLIGRRNENVTMTMVKSQKKLHRNAGEKKIEDSDVIPRIHASNTMTHLWIQIGFSCQLILLGLYLLFTLLWTIVKFKCKYNRYIERLQLKNNPLALILFRFWVENEENIRSSFPRCLCIWSMISTFSFIPRAFVPNFFPFNNN